MRKENSQPPLRIQNGGSEEVSIPFLEINAEITLEDITRENVPAESKTRTDHGRVGAGRRTAQQRGQAGPGRKGRRRSGSPKRHLSLVPTRVPKTTVLDVSSEARTKEFLCKPAEEQNPRLTRDSSAFQLDRES